MIRLETVAPELAMLAIYRVRPVFWYDQRRKSGIAYFTTAVAEDAAQAGQPSRQRRKL